MNVNAIQALGIALEAQVRYFVTDPASTEPEAGALESAIALCKTGLTGGQPMSHLTLRQPVINTEVDYVALFVGTVG